MKKWISFFLISALVGILLSGCGGPANTATMGDTTGIESSADEGTTDEVTDAETTAEPTETPTEEPTEAPTEEPTATPTEEPTEAPTEEPTEAPTKKPTEKPTEAPTEDPTEAPTPVLTIHDIAFVGDSRTLTMATGGRLEFNLVPATSVFATWGGELHQDSAKSNALNAAAANREMAIFWYGINDVQSDPGQTLSEQFLTNYRAIIDLYRANNPDSKVVILSILSTSVNEKDYYDGQEENIRTYNAKLANLCAAEGYTYLDITALFTGDECLAPNDNIHFSKEWYETRFLPTVLGALDIR